MTYVLYDIVDCGTVVRTTSPLTLHRRLEGSHPSLRIPAVVRDLVK